MSLQNLQAELAESILNPDENIKPVNVMQPDHLSIYQHNFQATLIRTLQHTYPLITKLVGEDFFYMTANEYIQRYPSCSGNLYDYGEYFSDFLTEYTPAKNLVYLAEVAQFEWISHTVFIANDTAPFDAFALQNIPSEQYNDLHFVLHPASHLKKFHYPILRIIDLCHENIKENIDLDEGGVNLLIIRRELDVSLAQLSTCDFIFLSALKDGSTLSQALAAAHAINPEFNLDEKLPVWIQDKTIVDFYL